MDIPMEFVKWSTSGDLGGIRYVEIKGRPYHRADAEKLRDEFLRGAVPQMDDGEKIGAELVQLFNGPPPPPVY
jgi:hypothetical protein